VAGQIAWLASYPKSGNTWVRAFLSAYDTGGEADLNTLPGVHAASVRLFAEHIGVESSDLSVEVVEEARASVLRGVAQQAGALVLCKTHDIYRFTQTSREVFPADVTKVVLYLVRHPLDVAVSWAAHSGLTLEEAVEFLCNSNATVSMARVPSAGRHLTQRLGSWSEHVSAWTQQRDLPVVLVRYEDLVLSPLAEFSRIVQALDLPFDSSRVVEAVAATSFERLQRQEATRGFHERPSSARQFFRRGQPGDGLGMPTFLVDRILDVHSQVMGRFGYFGPPS
jgi:hypothetical protein